MSTPVVVVRRVPCRSPLEPLWEALTDTDRLNWAIGMERLQVEPLVNPSAARYLVHTRLGGFAVEYEEEPFEWVYLDSFKVRRHMRRGPIRLLEMYFQLRPQASGLIEVLLQASLEPRAAILRPVIWFSGQRSLRALAGAIRSIDQTLAAGQAHLQRKKGPQVDKQALYAALGRVPGADRALLTRLRQLLEQGTDLEVERLRAFALADAWAAPRPAVLTMLLEAAVQGLLQLHWDLVCPSCRVATASLPSWSELAEHATCQLCDIKFSLNAEDALELVFLPATAVRRGAQGPYCVGGPARSPHVKAQVVLPAGGSASLKAPAQPGIYRLFVRGGASTILTVALGAADGLHLRCDQLTHALPQTLPPHGSLQLDNPYTFALHAKLEQSEHAAQAVGVGDVRELPAYCGHFSLPKIG